MTPKISIIVPVYNVENKLSRCIESILHQTYPFFELILVNDGSDDSSACICKDFAAKDRRIIFIDKVNTGVSATRNLGLSVAKGDFITFSDSDDWLEPQTFQICIDAINKYKNIDMVKFGYCRDMPDGTYELCTISNCMFLTDTCEVLKRTEESKYYAFVWNMFVKREVVNGVKFHEDINWLEDQIFGYDCMLKCSRILYVPNILYHYTYWETGSLSTVKNPKVIAKAALLEYYTKCKMINGKDLEIQNVTDDLFAWRMDLLVTACYLCKSSYNERKGYFKCTNPPFLLHQRESKFFFNRYIPFFVKDSLLRFYFIFKSMFGKNKIVRN